MGYCEAKNKIKKRYRTCQATKWQHNRALSLLQKLNKLYTNDELYVAIVAINGKLYLKRRNNEGDYFDKIVIITNVGT